MNYSNSDKKNTFHKKLSRKEKKILCILGIAFVFLILLPAVISYLVNTIEIIIAFNAIM